VARLLIGLMLVALVAAWLAGERILQGIGNIVVHEDPVFEAEVLVSSLSSPRVTALEVGRLYSTMPRARVLVGTWGAEAVVDELRRIGVPYADATEYSRLILERSGVPSDRISILGPADGTESEVRSVVSFVTTHGIRSLLVVTARSHTARTRWLLERSLPPDVTFAVRSSRFDSFAPERWWQRRLDSRELMGEYLRWLNSGVVGREWS
jgi:uncharacterized SAM-binding protein YcdF (DUF218 family)